MLHVSSCSLAPGPMAQRGHSFQILVQSLGADAKRPFTARVGPGPPMGTAASTKPPRQCRNRLLWCGGECANHAAHGAHRQLSRRELALVCHHNATATLSGAAHRGCGAATCSEKYAAQPHAATRPVAHGRDDRQCRSR